LEVREGANFGKLTDSAPLMVERAR